MSKVRATETKPEKLIRKFIFSKGFRYRKNSKSLPGKPDIILAKYKTVIFVHGCFWHGHKNCEAARLPKSNKVYWTKKTESNIKRDKKNIRELKKEGWNVIVIWECQITNKIKRQKTFNKLEVALQIPLHGI
jgi:DNA mismatch endonuclease, patch repair protein